MKKKIFCGLVAAFLELSAVHGAEKIEVRTFPDGFRDDRRGFIFSDMQSNLVLHCWAREKTFIGEDVIAKITLPENLKIVHFSVNRNPRSEKMMSSAPAGNGMKTWTLDAASVNYDSVFQVAGRYHTLPWSSAHIVIFVKPEGKIPGQFDCPWEIFGENVENISGVVRLKTMPAPRLSSPLKRLRAWSHVGYICNNHPRLVGAWTRETYENSVEVLKNAGITTLQESGGWWLPTDLVPLSEINSKFNMDAVYEGAFIHGLGRTDAYAKKAGLQLNEDDVALNLGGTRIANFRQAQDNGIRFPYCLTAFQEKNSVRRAMVRQYYNELIARGFSWFFHDSEGNPYNTCYCSKCRNAFARFAEKDEKQIQSLTAAELIYQYPVEWYCFQCDLVGSALGMLNQELEGKAKIGINSNLGNQEYYIPFLKSSGFVYFAEEPRLMDKYLAFHDADCLGTGQNSLFALETFLQKRDDGEFAVKKPVFVRATSCEWLNWFHTSTLGRYDYAISKGFSGLGLDYRRALHKIEIANELAIGAAGVEVSANPLTADAEALTGISEGLQFGADFEDYIRRKWRLPRTAITLYDCTQEMSPYWEITRKGLFSNYFRSNAQYYGNLQATIHQNADFLLVCLFNWDYYQPKKLRFNSQSLRLPASTCYVNISMDNEKYSLPSPISAEEFAGGMSIEVPQGAFAAILLTSRPLFPVRNGASLPSFPGGVEVKPFLLGTKQTGGMKLFLERTYNVQVSSIMALYPNAGLKKLDTSNVR